MKSEKNYLVHLSTHMLMHELIKFVFLFVCLFVPIVLVGLVDSLFYSVLNLIKMIENHPWLTTSVVFQFVDCFDWLAITPSTERVWQ